MRDFNIIFAYELKTQLGKKTTRVTTLILVLVVVLLTFLPRIIGLFDSGGPPKAPETAFEQAGYVFADDALRQSLTPLLGSVPEDAVYPDRAALADALKAKDVGVGFVFTDDLRFETLYLDRPPESQTEQQMAALLTEAKKMRLMNEKGVSAEDLALIEGTRAEGFSTVLGRDRLNNMMLAMALMVLVYMVVLLYGNGVSTTIAREKDSRTMEILITSTRPASLIIGKVAASGVAAVVQFGLVVLAGVIGYKLNQDTYPEMLRAMLSGSLTAEYLAVYLFFSITGYIMYLFLFAALGSTVSKMEDVGSATALVQFLFIFAYIISTFAMNLPDSAISVIGSIVPLTSVMVMPLRSAMSTVPIGQIILAGALMLLFVVFFAFLSIKIYRWGSLNYGNKTRLGRIVREALRHE
ncbi:MAG: ABC transporter permease [Clostridiales bacterium]|nr:ABC transporter permease [Clostridiales bacterium]